MKRKVLNTLLVISSFILASCSSVSSAYQGQLGSDKEENENPDIYLLGENENETPSLPTVDIQGDADGSLTSGDDVTSPDSEDTTSPDEEEPVTPDTEEPVIPDTPIEDIGGNTPIITLPEEKDETPSDETYEITFVNANGNHLFTTTINEGETPSYTGFTPTLPSTDKYSFTFKGWAPNIKPAHEDQVYVAQYEETKLYNVNIYDGDLLIDSYKCEEDVAPALEEKTYYKNDSDKYQYTFTGYDREAEPMDGDASYQALFDESLKEFNVNFYDYNYQTISSQTVTYGSLPEEIDSSLIPERTGYVFDGFKKDNSSSNRPVSYVTGNTTYYASYKEINTVTFYDSNYGRSYYAYVPDGEIFTLPVFLGDRVTYRYNSNTYYENDQIEVNNDLYFYIEHVDESIASSPRCETTINENGQVALTGIHNVNSSEVNLVVLPASVLDPTSGEILPITTLGDGINTVFRNNEDRVFETLYIPSTYQTIKTNSLANLYYLDLLQIPSSVTTIEPLSIYNTAQTEIYVENLEENVSFAENFLINGTSNVVYDSINLIYTTTTEDYSCSLELKKNHEATILSFTGSSSLEGITFPEKIYIGEDSYEIDEVAKDAFNGSSYLTSIELPETITKIGQGAFRNCTSLTSINIPDKVTEISPYTFYGCSSLQDIDLHLGIKSIGDYAFANTSLIGENDTFYLNDKTTIEGYIFRLPALLEEIGNHAFENTSLQYVLVSKYVTTIGENSLSANPYVVLLMEHEQEETGFNTLWANEVAKDNILFNVRETNRIIDDYERN